ncbi:MAG: helix-turn-helix domain-containing protein [Planctomycetaceae bacterium]
MARPRRLNWTQLIEEGPSAIIALDGDCRIRSVSPGVTELTGWTNDDLGSLRCYRTAASDQELPGENPLVDLVTSSLAPPDICQQGMTAEISTVLPDAKGNSVSVNLTFVPLQESLPGTEPSMAAATLVILNRSPIETQIKSVASGSLKSLHAEINALRLDLRRRFGRENYLGKCSLMRRALRQAELLKSTASPFAVSGPEGSGRRHLIRLIHLQSPLSDQSLAFLDCHLLASSVLLSTLHQLRTAGGPVSTMPHHRTALLVLVELQMLPLDVQRWLVDHYAFDSIDDHSSVGDKPSGIKSSSVTTGNVQTPVRLAATSQYPLSQLLNDGRLLPELHARLSDIEVQLPPLNQRGDDVLLLFQHFMDQHRRDHKSPATTFSKEVQDQLQAYRWPGQVRELHGVASEACRNCTGSVILPEHLPWHFRVAQDAQRNAGGAKPTIIQLETLLEQFEVELITAAMVECEGNKTEVARRLGLTRPKLYRRMKTLGLDAEVDEDGPLEPSDSTAVQQTQSEVVDEQVETGISTDEH